MSLFPVALLDGALTQKPKTNMRILSLFLSPFSTPQFFFLFFLSLSLSLEISPVREKAHPLGFLPSIKTPLPHSAPPPPPMLFLFFFFCAACAEGQLMAAAQQALQQVCWSCECAAKMVRSGSEGDRTRMERGCWRPGRGQEMVLCTNSQGGCGGMGKGEGGQTWGRVG